MHAGLGSLGTHHLMPGLHVSGRAIAGATQAAVHHRQQVGVLQSRCHAFLVVQLLVDGCLAGMAARPQADVKLPVAARQGGGVHKGKAGLGAKDCSRA